jgi:hypothetical protein
MAKRVLVIDGDDNAHFLLSVQAGTLTIGTDATHPTATLRDLRVAHIHCEVEIEEDQVLVTGREAGSGAAAESQALRVGDALDIGAAHVRFALTPDQPPSVHPGGGGEHCPGSAAPFPQETPAVQAVAAPPAVGRSRRLLVVDGADQGRSFPVAEAGRTTIGKSAKQVDIVLHDFYVSRVHCELQAEGDRVFVTHVEGPGGTLINGKKITRQELRLGDILRVGNSHLRFEIGVGEPRSASDTVDEMGTFAVEAVGKKGGATPAAAPAVAGRAEVAMSFYSVEPLLKLEGQALGHYQFGALLGRGQTGLVFRAHHRQNNQPVAVKVLSADFPQNDTELQGFIRALKVVAPLRHPHLVTLFAAGKTGPYCWIAREYVEGDSLAALIGRVQAEGKGGWKRACRVAVQLGKALDYLHQQQVICGNLTPANVLIQGDTKTTKVADLMLDQALRGSRLLSMLQPRQRLGVLPYRAPEQLDGDTAVDHRTTLYALGAMLHALLTGQPPFGGDSVEEMVALIRQGSLVRPSKFLRDLPAPFEAAVLKLMARRPEDRIQTAADLLAVVEPIANMHEIPV